MVTKKLQESKKKTLRKEIKRKYAYYQEMVRKLILKNNNKENDKIGIKNKKTIFKYWCFFAM